MPQRDAKALVQAAKARMAALEAENRKFKEQASRKVSLPGVNETGKAFSFAKVIRCLSEGGLNNENAWRANDAMHEYEVGRETMKRVLQTNGSAQYIVPQEYLASEFAPLLRAKNVVLQAGARLISGLQGSPVRIPKQSASSTVYVVGEGSAITPSDQTYAEESKTPVCLAALTKFSNKLSLVSNPDAEALVRDDLASAISSKMDQLCLEGNVDSGEFDGIRNYTGCLSITGVGVPVFDDILEGIYNLQLNNAPEDGLALICHPRTLYSLRKQRLGGSTTTDGPYAFIQDPTNPLRGTIAGVPVYTSTNISITEGTGGAESYMILGHMPSAIVLQWGSLELAVSAQAGDSFAYMQQYCRASVECSMALRHPGAFLVYSDVTVS